jgi:GTPase
MKKLIKFPKVLLVGRTNVGKSALFNCISGEKHSIVLHEEGVTRDYISQVVSFDDKKFELIDTGGISFTKKQLDEITGRVKEKVLALLDHAALILFVCDGKNGLTKEDLEVAKTLRKIKKPIFVLINKADNTNAVQENLSDFYSLGFKEIIQVSALHKIGINDLLEKIIETIPAKADIEEESIAPAYKIVILGKPNVGKSSLMNILTHKERSIVTPQAGTTREAVSENIFFAQDIIQITDTAGIRKKARVTDTLESLMVKSSLNAVRSADIVLIMIDASEQQLSDQELKLLFYAYEQNKSVILVCNKMDLVSESDRENFEHNLSLFDFILKKIPIVWISCKNKKNIGKVTKKIEQAIARLGQTFNATELNEVVKTKFLEKPIYRNEKRLKIFKIRCIASKTPTFVLIVNHKELWGPSQLGFVENILREHYDLEGCPIKFTFQEVK